MKPPQNVNSHKSKSSLKMGHRVHTDLEKSWKMTLVLENSWNSKKCNLTLNCPGILKIISLIITKSP